MPIWLPELTQDLDWFPDPEFSLPEPDGLLAFGGCLSPQRLVSAYRQGIFPWFNEEDPLLWWSPSIRAIFPQNSLKLNRSLKKFLKNNHFSFSCNTAFAEVIAQCALTRQEKGTWIQANIQQAYLQLHRLGKAHSIEVWQDGHLVGGCYGVQVGELFCGESMFNLAPNAAKLALLVLQQELQKVCDGIIDCQMPNPFLMQMGAEPLPRSDYLCLLRKKRDLAFPQEVWRPRSIQLLQSEAS